MRILTQKHCVTQNTQLTSYATVQYVVA